MPKLFERNHARSHFLQLCERFIPDPAVGGKAGVFRRFMATFLDPFIGFLVFLPMMLLAGAIGGALGERATVTAFFLTLLIYGVFYLWMLSRGMTPGKWVLSEWVVNKHTGGYPGLGRMLVREIIGKSLSGLFFGIGYLWALFDKDGQAWHDKLAGTVVVVRKGKP